MAVVGFTLVNWGIGSSTLDQAFAEAGSSIFTLGFTLEPHRPGSHIVDFVAAGTGLVLVALQIAYLPTIYSSYNRRETLVTLLESRAGAPAWGPELLIRHQLVGLIDNLPNLFADWERWAADVAESHTSYPSLLYLRSPRPQNSWLVSLIAVMDAAAIALAVDPDGAPIESRMVVRMGFTCLRDIAQVTGIAFDPDPDPDDPIELPEEEFAAAFARLRGDRLPDLPSGRRGLAPLPGLAGQLRGRRLRPGLGAQRPARPVVRAPPPVPGGVPRTQPPGRPPTQPSGGRPLG